MLLQCRSEHTLPVTSIHVGAGQANALAVTCSLDRSCKIWSLAQGKACHGDSGPYVVHILLAIAGLVMLAAWLWYTASAGVQS